MLGQTVSSHCMNLGVCVFSKKKKKSILSCSLLIYCVCQGEPWCECGDQRTSGSLLPPIIWFLYPGSHLVSPCTYFWIDIGVVGIENKMWRIKGTKKDTLWAKVWSPQKHGGSSLFSSLLTLNVRSTVNLQILRCKKERPKVIVLAVFWRSNLLIVK